MVYEGMQWFTEGMQCTCILYGATVVLDSSMASSEETVTVNQGLLPEWIV